MKTALMMSQSDGPSGLAAELSILLADAFTMSFRAQAAHWNVRGPDFHQYHGFFAMIYEDVEGSIDATAENIRKLGFDAPMNLSSVVAGTMIADDSCACDAMSLVSSLNDANDVVITRLNSVFAAADAINAQAIADFAASRLDMHEKWRWQMRATLGVDMMPAQIVIEQPSMTPVDAVDFVDHRDGGFFASGEAPRSKPIQFSRAAELELRDRLTKHNESAPAGRLATLAQVKAVYRRGARSASDNHHNAGTARVASYLSALARGRACDDTDLLPRSHRLSTADKRTLTASAIIENELHVALRAPEQYESENEMLLDLAEFSSGGYEIVSALRRSIGRAIDRKEPKFSRAYDLALRLYDGKDSDLLPRTNKGETL